MKPKSESKKTSKNEEDNIVTGLQLNKKTIYIVTSIIVIVGGILGILSALYVLYSDISIVGKLSGVVFFYGLVFFIWQKVKDSNARKILSLVICAFSAFIIIWAVDSHYKYIVEREKIEKAQLKDQRKTKFFSKSDKRYKILVLPFQSNTDKKFEIAGSAIYNHLKTINETENLHDTIVFGDQLFGLDTRDSASYFKNFHNADLIIYGQFYPSEGTNSASIQINYITTDKWKIGIKNLRIDTIPLSTTLIGLNSGKLQGDIDFIMQYLVAYEDINKQDYKKAIARFNKIKDNIDSDKVDFFIGYSYSMIESHQAAISYYKKCISKNSNFIEAHINLCYEYLYTNNLKDAEYESKNPILQDHTKINAFNIKGIVKLYLHDFKGSIEDYNKIITLDQNNASAYINRGVGKMMLNEYKEAFNDFSIAIGIDPSAYLGYVNRGVILDISKDYYGAISEYTKAITLNPNFNLAYYNRGMEKIFLKDINGALGDYYKAIECNPKDTDAYIKRGLCKLMLEDYNGAILDFTKTISLDPKNIAAYNNRGIVYGKIHDEKRSIFDFTKAIVIDPKNSQSYSNRGREKMLLEDYSGALFDFNKSILLNPKNHEDYLNRGLVKAKLNNHFGAISDYTKVIDISPNDAGAYYNRGNENIFLRNYKKAVEDFSIYISLKPEEPFGYANRSLGYLKLLQNENAIKDIEKQITLTYNKSALYEKLGYIYKKLGKNDLAIINFKKSLKSNKKTLTDNINIAQIYYLEGNNIESERYLKVAISLDNRLAKGIKCINEIFVMESNWTKKDTETLIKMIMKMKISLS